MNRPLRYLGRIGICILLFVIYIYAWRPVRTAITQKIVYTRLNDDKSVRENSYTVKDDGVALRISFPWNDMPKTIQYRPSAGFFFLIGMVTLVVIAAKWKWYVILTCFHLLMTCTTAFIMFLSKSGWYPGFIIVDLLVTYLVPALTLGFVGWIASNGRVFSGRGKSAKHLSGFL